MCSWEYSNNDDLTFRAKLDATRAMRWVDQKKFFPAFHIHITESCSTYFIMLIKKVWRSHFWFEDGTFMPLRIYRGVSVLFIVMKQFW